MSDEEDDLNTCPLCEEEMDLSDRNFLPCPCGYRVCMWCWHHIRENLNGLCPACRTPYNSDPHAFAAVDRDLIVKKNRERKQKEKIEKRIADKASAGMTSKATVVTFDRKTLHNFRVVQRNLLYVIGLPISLANEDLLRKPEYFGQYGKIAKIVAHKNQGGTHPTASAYVTFTFKEDAKAAIQALDGYWIEGHPLRASFGTTKYCNNFIKNVPCSNPECVYLHELGDDDDRFTKEEIQAGHTKLNQVPGKDQTLVTGAGGPSGTGKRPVGETVLPPPVFIQENASIKSGQKQSMTSELKETDAYTDQSPLLMSQNNEKSLITSDLNEELVEDAVRDDGYVINREFTSLNQETHVQHNETESKDVPSSMDTNYMEAPTFNGLTLNAVFPVPVSSLKITVWSIVLRDNQNTLTNNPFSQLLFPFSELLNLTLPPVDATTVPNYKIYREEQKFSVKEEKHENSIHGVWNDSELASIQQTADSQLNQDSIRTSKAINDVDGRKASIITANSSFSALRQLFPGVNLAYGVTPLQIGPNTNHMNRAVP